MSQAQRETLQAYLRLMNTNASVHIFRAAVRLGIFDALVTGTKTLDQLVRSCNLSPEPTQLLLDALCALGVVERYDDEFAAAQVIQLMPSALRDLGDRYWEHLAQFVRTGTPIPACEEEQLNEADFHAEAAASEWLLTPSALDFADVLGIGSTRRDLQVLELAAGSAVWSLTLAHRDPGTQITVVDREDRLTAAVDGASAIGVADQLRTVAADYRRVQLPADSFDLVIVANLVHVDTRQAAEALMTRAFGWLRPGGELAVVDVFPGQERGELQHRLYSLSVALRTQTGRVCSPDDMRTAIREAGFQRIQFAHLPSPPHVMGLMLAWKSESAAIEIGQ